jgi:hypothetical protein
VRIENAACDFCGGDLAALEEAHAARTAAIRAATLEVRAAMAKLAAG